MGELTLEYFCRLCLKETFSLVNVFTHNAPSGDVVYEILNYVYDLKIHHGDGLPCRICKPCLWRVIEFHACKKNVKEAELEILRLNTQMTKKNSKDPSEYSGIEQNGRLENGEIELKKDTQSEELRSMEEIEEKETEYCDNSEISVKEELELEETKIEKGEINTEVRVKEEFRSIEFAEEIQNINAQELSPEAGINFDAETDDVCDLDSSEMSAVKMETMEMQQLPSGGSQQMDKDSDADNFRNLRADTSCVPRTPLFLGEWLPAQGLASKLSRKCPVRFGTKEAHFPCGMCGRRFRCDSHLKTHMRVHRRDKLFDCPVCAKRFHLKESLEHHLVGHSVPKPFSCNLCARAFKSSQAKNRHELIHYRVS